MTCFSDLYILLLLLCFLVLYYIIDFLMRIPRIGNYGGRYIFVTGCDIGFGNLLAKRLDELGCHVFAGCLTEKGETELKKACSQRLHAVSLDVSKPENVQKALDYVKGKLPQGKGLWGLVNNAGVNAFFGPPDWMTVDDYKKQCDVNLWGLVDVTLTFLPLMKVERGRIVNMASIGGRLTFAQILPYSVSKYGVEAFTDGLRRSLYHFGCYCSVIEPGSHMTPILDVSQFSATYAKCWERAKPDVKADYGEEYAKYLIENGSDSFTKLASTRLADVVDAYEHALLARYPRARYPVGFDAKYVYLTIQALPEWIGDLLVRLLEACIPLPPDVRNSTLGISKRNRN